MSDLHQIKAASLEEALRQIPDAAVVVEAPSGKLILINERARQLLEQNAGWSGLLEPGEVGDFGDLRMFDPDGRPVEMEEWPLVRSMRSGEEVRDEEHSYLLADGSRLTIRSDASPIHDDEGRIVAGVLIVRDVTERKQAAEEQERLAKIVQNSSDFIGICDLDWQVSYVNEAGQRLVGLGGMEEARRTRVPDYVVPEDRAFVADEMFAAVMEDGRWTGELNLRHFETGEQIPVNWEVFRIDDPTTGDPFSITTIARDISSRKRDEEALRESGRRTEDILESVTDAFYALDREWRLTYLNERALRFASQLAGEEFTLERLLGQTLWETLPAIVGTSIEDEYRRAVREQQTAVFEYPYPGGGPIFEVHAYPSEQGLSIYFRDITERKKAEQATRTHARQQAAVAELGLRALANHDLQSLMDDTVALVARALYVECCRVVEILPGGEELLLRAGFGWQEGAVGSTAEIDPQVAYTLSSSGPVTFEDLEAETRFEPSPMLRAHGVVSGMTVLIPGREEPYGALGAHTATRRIFSEEDANFLQAVANVLATAIEREEAEEKLHQVREAERSRMARDLHDEALRDLTYALVEAQYVQSTLKELTPVHRLGRLVAALKRTGQHLRGAIYDLRLGGEQDRPFSELLESLVELHRTMAPECDIRLDVGDGVLSSPLGESGTELLRVVGEALTNARRHSEARNVWVSVWASGEKLRAEVSDDGRGFDPDEEMSASREATGGTGIKGMRERARAQDGDLEIESQPAGGTKVRFELTLKKARAELETQEPREGEPAEEPRQKVRILLVEDHAAVREAIAASFEREAGFGVTGQAASLAEARQVLSALPAAEPVDVAVVDLGLPDGYGGDLIRELRETNPETQALVLSAGLDRAETARAVEAGAAGILHKTAHLDEVVEAVRRLRAGETLLPLEEVVELLRFAGNQREQGHEARRAIALLTPREKEVLQTIAEGLDSGGSAERLNISVRTQRNHISSILAKLGVHSQLQALVFALRHGVVEIPQYLEPHG